MSAHESMEHAEHAEHASGENRKIALLIAVIALCLALSETLGKGAQTESISLNVQASNLWAFFQAKSIRRTVVQTAADQGKLALGSTSDDAVKAALQKQIEDWQKTAARYRSEQETGEGTEQLAERAKHAEEERDLATAKYHHYELAFRCVPDRHRPRVCNHHYRHDRAGVGVRPVDPCRDRHDGARRLCAAPLASALNQPGLGNTVRYGGGVAYWALARCYATALRARCDGSAQSAARSATTSLRVRRAACRECAP